MTNDRFRLLAAGRLRAGALGTLAFLASAATTFADVTPEQTLSIAPAGVVTWDEMLRYEALGPRAPAGEEHRVVPIMPAPEARDLGAAASSAALPGSALQAPAGFSPSPPMVTAGFVALPDNNTSIPPDTMGAAGPSHLVAMLNTEVRVQNKAAGIISTVSLSTFWTSGTGLVGSPFDPRIVYDSLSGRWIAAVDADGNSATSQVWFAISATSDPTLAWTFYGFTADGSGTTWADFPGFGVNTNWIAITNNMYSVSVLPAFAGSKMWVIDKATALAGGPLTVSIFPTFFDFEGTFGTFGFALQPTVTFGATLTLHIIDNTGFASGGTALLRLSRITGTGPAPVWSVAPGSVLAGTGLFFVANNFSFGLIGAEQSGIPSTCSGGTNNGLSCFTTANCDPPSGGICRRIDTGDGRIGSLAVFRNGRVWATHSGGRPAGAVDRTSVLWYQLDPTSAAAPIVQSGVVEGAAGVHHYYPSIAANMNDDACVGFSRSDSSKFIEAAAAGRLGTDAPGTTGAVTVLKAGEDSYFKTFSGNRNRWGDYSATVIDPSDDLSFWTIQEYAAFDVGVGPNDDRWSTWWSKKEVATPTSTPTNTPPPTSTPTATITPTSTITPTGTGLPTSTTTDTPTATPTMTPTQNFACPATPDPSCATPGKAILLVKDKAPDGASAKDKLNWKWLKGPAVNQSDFGDPVGGGTSYTFCLYDTAGLVTDLTIPGGGTCAGSPCWKAISTKGYRYKDKNKGNDGVLVMILKGNASPGKSKIVLKGKDGNLPIPALPLDDSVSVTAQLHRADGPQCWQAVYPGPGITNTFAPGSGGQFKDKIP
jgi:hypothetical protein